MAMMRKEPPERKATVVYDDQHIMIETGVKVRDFCDVNSPRALDNAIKITAKAEDVHFIQFATQQYPDIFSFEHPEFAGMKTKVLRWFLGDDFVDDGVTPKWKLDIVEKDFCHKENFNTTIYYEEKGAHVGGAGFFALLDHPGGLFERGEQRFVYCTFVIVNSQVTHLVKWSKQWDVEEKEFYSVDCNTCGALPYWAVLLLTQKYGQLLNGDVIFHGLGKNFKPGTLEEEEQELRQSFLVPPKNWCTFVEYPGLFSNITAGQIASQKEKMGPEQLSGWELQNVLGDGNCFYYATIDQFHSVLPQFFKDIYPGTEPHNVLRLRIQGRAFRDGEWAGIEEIRKLVVQLNVIVAIVDTRHPELGYRYYYRNESMEFKDITDKNQLPPGIPVVKLAFTGNHYLSVHRDLFENVVSNNEQRFPMGWFYS